MIRVSWTATCCGRPTTAVQILVIYTYEIHIESTPINSAAVEPQTEECHDHFARYLTVRDEALNKNINEGEGGVFKVPCINSTSIIINNRRTSLFCTWYN